MRPAVDRRTRNAAPEPSRSLGRAEALRTLSADVVQRLATHSRPVVWRKNDTIFLAGGPPALYVLTLGRVAILSQPTPNVEIELFLRQPYELIGEASLFVGAQVDQARALESVQATQIEVIAVRRALEQCPLAASAFAGLLARRLMDSQERVAELGVHNVTQRLLLLLTRLARECNVADSRGALIPYRLTQDELGRLVGASRVAVSHAIRRLRQDGHITTAGRRIIVCRESGTSSSRQREERFL